MAKHPRLIVSAALALGMLLVAIGIVYLVVACEDLPGVLGPHPGDTSPRTPLGVVVLVAGLAVLAGAVAGFRRRPPSPPIQP